MFFEFEYRAKYSKFLIIDWFLEKKKSENVEHKFLLFCWVLKTESDNVVSVICL